LQCRWAPQRPLNPTAIAIEILNSGGFQPLHDITITLSYSPGDIGTSPESMLSIARYDDTNHRWILLASTVDEAANTVACTTGHLSTFALVRRTAGTDLRSVTVYPNPYKPGSGTAHDSSALGKGIVFSGLTARARVKIFTITGELVRDLDTSGGLAIWDAANTSGNPAASGVYVFRITDPDDSSHTATGKLAIER